MSEQADRDALAEVVMAQVYIRGPIRAGHADALVLTSVEALPVADAILASDWLAQRDRRVAAAVLREAADVWQQGAWIDAPKSRHLPAQRFASGQYATDWLRERADRIERGA